MSDRLRNGRTLGEELLIPTRIYHESLEVASACTVHGMCHITGGGLLNLKRLSRYGFRIDTPVTPPEIFLMDPENRGYFNDRDVPHFQYGNGICLHSPPRKCNLCTEGCQGNKSRRGSYRRIRGVAPGYRNYLNCVNLVPACRHSSELCPK